MPFNRYYLIFLAFFFGFYANAQTQNDFIIEQLVESLSEDLGEDFDYAELTERLNYYHKHPIDLNKTDEHELLELRFLSPVQIEQILKHRQLAGNFMSIYELQTVKGLDLNTIRLLTPFVQVNLPSAFQGKQVGDFIHKGKQDLLFRYGRVLTPQKGYTITDTTRARYLGSPNRLFMRYRYQYGKDLQIAINMKKDAGEQFFSGAQRYGFDFYSASIAIANQKRWKKVVLGDYTLQFGQGLGLWTGLSFGKGALIQNIARQGMGLRAYTSSNEFSFFRGIAASYEWKSFTITPFISYKRLTATIADEALNQYSAISQSGLHRTPSEAANKNRLGQLLYGANVAYQKEHFNIGLTAYQGQLDGELSPRPSLYNRFSFHGRSLTDISTYYHYSLHNVYFFGEVAYSLNRGLALLNGLVAPLSPQLSLALLYRNYQKEYYSFYNQGFAEGSTAANEKGFYTGLIFQPNKKIQWVTYADYFRFPWLKYRVDAPSSGYDLFSQLTYAPSKKVNFNIRYRYRKKEENGETAMVNWVVPLIRQQVRIAAQYALNKSLTLRNRFEYVNYQKGNQNEEGYLFYQDVIAKPLKSKWSGNIRLALFHTTGYNARIYAYESDLLYAYSFPFYSDKGWRYYINLRYRITRGMDVWCRYASFIYLNKDQVGSALDLIDGNKKSEIKLQIRLQF